MKKILFALFLFPFLLLAQTGYDRIELNNGKIFDGKVVKVTSNTIEFVDNTTNLNYEFQKSEVKYLRLNNGTILTFDDQNQNMQTEEQEVIGGNKDNITEGRKVEPVPSTTPEPAQPIEVEEEEDGNFSKTIITVAGAAAAVVLVALLIF